MKTTLTLLALLTLLNVSSAGELTLKQTVAEIPISEVSLRLIARSRGDYEHLGKRQSQDDLIAMVTETPGAIEYVYISGEDLTIQHLLELARMGQTHGFQTLYHQNGVLKLITVE